MTHPIPGWEPLPEYARRHGVERRRLLRALLAADRGTGQLLRRSTRNYWVVNARRLEAMAGPSRGDVESIASQVDGVSDAIRSIERRVRRLEHK